MKFSTIAPVALFFAVVSAAPLDVYVPPVLTPQQGDIWILGQNETVTWDVSNPPQRITNPIGRIMLRKGDFTLDVTLADGFDILLGTMNVTVPVDQIPGDDYTIVLFGDSGNFSPTFAIQAASFE
ncbi:hypothetical protein C8J56DRAFT_916678 [Mycena floridula]|nr:hypothetical protein C8J56DRAFT_916678 [Mycena floridula]